MDPILAGWGVQGKALIVTETAPRSVFQTAGAEARYRAIYDARVADWPVPYEELDVVTDFGVTHIIASGPPDAPPLFLFNAMMVGATQWRSSAEALSRHFRIYAVDRMGEPSKSKPTRPIRNRQDYADWFSGLLDAMDIDRASLVGNSYGGFLSLSLASLAPDRVDRVVLLSPAETVAPIGLWFYVHIFVIGLGMLSPRSRARAFTSMITWVANGVEPDPRDENLAELMAIAILEGAHGDVIRPHLFSKAELAAIRAPTLLLIGDREVIYPPERSLRRARARMPALETALIPGANHLTAMARPDLVHAAIIEFLQRKIP